MLYNEKEQQLYSEKINLVDNKFSCPGPLLEAIRVDRRNYFRLIFVCGWVNGFLRKIRLDIGFSTVTCYFSPTKTPTCYPWPITYILDWSNSGQPNKTDQNKKKELLEQDISHVNYEAKMQISSWGLKDRMAPRKKIKKESIPHSLIRPLTTKEKDVAQ